MQYEQRKAVLEAAEDVRFTIGFDTSNNLRHLRREPATKPRTPTSTVNRCAFHWAKRHASSRPSYLVFFLNSASTMLSSFGIVSSIKRTVFVISDQMTISGRCSVAVMDREKMIGWAE